jgi:glycerophosphoryl diester phosphodiesterase
VTWLTAAPIAHRGVHDDNVDIAENSIPAFRAAIDRGWPIELDVRLLGDGTPVVFHDANLRRLCGIDRSLRTVVADDLRHLRLPGGCGPIPTLPEALAAVAGAVPVIVECKPHGRRGAVLSRVVHEALAGYHGTAAVLSFDPRIVSWFARREPRRPRGVNGGALPIPLDRLFLAQPIPLRPHFVGFRVERLPSPVTARLRQRGLPVLAFTVRTRTQQRIAEQHADGMFLEVWDRVDPVLVPPRADRPG